LRRHSFADPLKNPGQADVTAHVDFQALARAAEDVGARVHGPVTQGDFLKRLGIETRAVTLMGKTTPEVSADISAALKRLTDSGRGGMGSMFKVLAVTEPNLTMVAGLSDEPQAAGRRNSMTFGSSLLAAIPGLRHAFFTREGGVSSGIYKGLNGGSAPTTIRPMSRKIAAGWPSRWASRPSACSARTRSIHPTSWWRPDHGKATSRAPTRSSQRRKASPSASPPPDCGPVLFADAAARVIGAAHAGWKGALTACWNPPSTRWRNSAPTAPASSPPSAR
jgi:hypothetical protein